MVSNEGGTAEIPKASEREPTPDHEEHGNEEAYANIIIRQRWQRGHAKTIKEQGNEEQNKPCVTDEVELLWITGKFKKMNQT